MIGKLHSFTVDNYIKINIKISIKVNAIAILTHLTIAIYFIQ